MEKNPTHSSFKLQMPTKIQLHCNSLKLKFCILNQERSKFVFFYTQCILHQIVCHKKSSYSVSGQPQYPRKKQQNKARPCFTMTVRLQRQEVTQCIFANPKQPTDTRHRQFAKLSCDIKLTATTPPYSVTLPAGHCWHGAFSFLPVRLHGTCITR